MEHPRDILKRIWGYPDFRPGQLDIIQAVLDGKDALALLPTGGGKSLCYQVPALAQEGLCVVVSPLIALMEDQVQHLRQLGVGAASVTSALRADQVDTVMDNAVFGRYKFLYVSPERLSTTLFVERFKRMKVNLIAVDEAHCISEWGHDFRPAYREIAVIRKYHLDVPVLALTATATPEAVFDIQERLAFGVPLVFQQSFHRPNLGYMTLQEPDKFGMLLRMCRKNQGSGIVYAPTRRQTQQIAHFLYKNGVTTAAYHAGLDAHERSAIQDAWVHNRLRVVVATNAFGMGIDKPDVRFVVHLHIPASPEAYFQEAGRGGRDGLPAHAVLLWDRGDLDQLDTHFQETFPELKRVREVYDSTLGFLRVAYGAGAGTSHPLELGELAKRYNWKSRETYRALQFLETAGYLTLSDSFHHPTTFQFTCHRQGLYDFQVRYPGYQPVVDDLLRVHEGIFEWPARVDVRGVAKRLKWTEPRVLEVLQLLQELDLGMYTPASNAPQLTLVHERLRPDNLGFDTEQYERRKATGRKQLEAMVQLTEGGGCRSMQLLAYFGEQDSEPCGKCDVCRGLHQEAPTASQQKQLQAAISDVLQDRPMHATEVVDALRDDHSPLHITGVLHEGVEAGLWDRNASGLFFTPGDS